MPDAAWCWFQDPRAVHSNGKTYYGINNRAGDIVIGAYTHDTTEKNVRPVVPRNHAPGLDVMWMRGDYPHFLTFDTDYLGYSEE